MKNKKESDKKEITLDNFPLNDLVGFSEKLDDKIKSSDLLKLVEEKLKLDMNSRDIKKLMTFMGFEHKKFRDGMYYMQVQLIEDLKTFKISLNIISYKKI